MHVWQGRNEAYYNGFREHHLLGVFINLFCCLAYYAKILESMTEHGAGFPIFTTIKYMDYVFTWSVRPCASNCCLPERVHARRPCSHLARRRHAPPPARRTVLQY